MRNQNLKCFPIREPIGFEIVEISRRDEVCLLFSGQPNERSIGEIHLAIRVSLHPAPHGLKVVQAEIHAVSYLAITPGH